MDIKTKMNVGEQVFFISNKKVVNNVIRGIKIEVTDSKTDITYLCNEETDARLHIKVDENDAYISKEELVKSL